MRGKTLSSWRKIRQFCPAKGNNKIQLFLRASRCVLPVTKFGSTVCEGCTRRLHPPVGMACSEFCLSIVILVSEIVVWFWFICTSCRFHCRSRSPGTARAPPRGNARTRGTGSPAARRGRHPGGRAARCGPRRDAPVQDALPVRTSLALRPSRVRVSTRHFIQASLFSVFPHTAQGIVSVLVQTEIKLETKRICARFTPKRRKISHR